MSESIKKIICIRCPQGCEVSAKINDGKVESVEGNICKLGKEYATTEITDPRRIITSSVKVRNGFYPLVPVWTTQPIPKNKIFDLMDELRKIELQAPVQMNQLVLKDFAGIGVDVIASRPCKCSQIMNKN